MRHKIVATPEEAGAIAGKSRLRPGMRYHLYTPERSRREKDHHRTRIDVAVKRLFTARFKLGMFDPPSMVKYAAIPYSVVDSKEHKQLALESARKSIVLLKNDHQLLPLKKGHQDARRHRTQRRRMDHAAG